MALLISKITLRKNYEKILRCFYLWHLPVELVLKYICMKNRNNNYRYRKKKRQWGSILHVIISRYFLRLLLQPAKSLYFNCDHRYKVPFIVIYGKSYHNDLKQFSILGP